MNYPEKIAGAYLRLNGFFLLPHFTVFDQQYHTHVDFLALRPPSGRESIEVEPTIIFPIDDYFMNTISECVNDPKANLIGSAVEVRGNTDKIAPSVEHIEYTKRFFGDKVEIFKLSFYSYYGKPELSGDIITVSIEYAFKWIVTRINWMNNNLDKLIKTKSWNMSEEFLSEILYLIEHKLIKKTF